MNAGEKTAEFPIQTRNALESLLVAEFGEQGLTMHSGGSGGCGFDLGMHVGDENEEPVSDASLELIGEPGGYVKCKIVTNYYSVRDDDEPRSELNYGFAKWSAGDPLPEKLRNAARKTIELAQT